MNYGFDSPSRDGERYLKKLPVYAKTEFTKCFVNQSLCLFRVGNLPAAQDPERYCHARYTIDLRYTLFNRSGCHSDLKQVFEFPR